MAASLYSLPFPRGSLRVTVIDMKYSTSSQDFTWNSTSLLLTWLLLQQGSFGRVPWSQQHAKCARFVECAVVLYRVDRPTRVNYFGVILWEVVYGTEQKQTNKQCCVALDKLCPPQQDQQKRSVTVCILLILSIGSWGTNVLRSA